MILYATENYLAGTDVTISASSEDPLYVLENLYNRRPSKPFRFTGIGSAGNPEWICAEFDAPKRITLAAVFNHNLTTLPESIDELTLEADDAGCSGATWGAPDYAHALKPHLVADWNDLYARLDETRLSWYLAAIDSLSPAAFIEIGELFLGQAIALSSAYLQPGRQESPRLYRAANVTHYGQHWTEAYSESITLDLTIKNLNNPAQVDAVRKMILAIHGADGKFVIIPDPATPFIYYAHLENDGGFMSQLMRGPTCELTQWSLQLRTLTKGISLL